jgi:hypothetical protein
LAAFSLFGFQISRKEDDIERQNVEQSFTPPSNDDGALTISQAAYYGTYVDLDGSAKNEVELIGRYREMAMQPEIESAIDDICNEAIVQNDDGENIKIVLDKLEVSPKIKKAIEGEFGTILRLLNYNNMAPDIFRRFYIDGRLFYHILIDRENPTMGIKELRYIDPRKIRKVREVKKDKDARTGVEMVVVTNEYYIFNDKSVNGSQSNYGPVGVRIAKDSIINVNSGLMDSRRAAVLSYLHKAIKPLNQLRMIEDATVIYRISRAPERRIFYIDVGNLPKMKAEQYLRDIMVKYKNKVVYDAQTGEVRDERKHLSMMEDFWLPRREGGKGTEIQTLPGGQNLGELEDVKYFEKKLYKALNVPISRMESSTSFTIGRATEITRDEVKFAKFVNKLRNRFTELFDYALRVQCVLKGICTEDEWNIFKESIYYDFIRDNNYAELKDAEILRERLSLLAQIDAYTGRYYSMDWIRRNVLRMNDDEIKTIDDEIAKERKNGVPMPADLQYIGMSSGDAISPQTPTLEPNPMAQPGEPDAQGQGGGTPKTASSPKPKQSSSSGGGDLNLKQQ